MTDATAGPFPSRWGPDDELGALNLITPESTLAALAMIKQAKTYDLSHVLEGEMPVPGFHGQFFANTQFTLENGEEWHHKHLGIMKNGYSAQNLRINMSDQSGTHIDNLNHIGQRQADGEYYLYNNVRNKDVIDTFGTRRLGMENVPAFIARGISGRRRRPSRPGHPAGRLRDPTPRDRRRSGGPGGDRGPPGRCRLHSHRMGQALGGPGDPALRRAGARQGLRRVGQRAMTS